MPAAGTTPLLTKQYIDEHQVLERYLADQLSNLERDQFEDYYAEHPEVLRDLEAVASIKMGTELLRESGELQTLLRARRAPRWRSGLALAAALLVAILAAGYWFRNDATSPVILAGRLDAFPTQLTLGKAYQVQRTRGDADALITLPPSPQALQLRVRPMFEPQPPSFRIQLSSIAEASDARTALASLDKLRLDADGFLTFYIDSARLQPGNYELRVSNASTGATTPTVSDFLIEVVP
jgi:hypothetical protein